jgi:hypothetical protein
MLISKYLDSVAAGAATRFESECVEKIGAGLDTSTVRSFSLRIGG